MAVRSGKDIRDQLHDACCKCKTVREAAERHRVMRDTVDSGEVRPQAQIQPSSSFSAMPGKR